MKEELLKETKELSNVVIRLVSIDWIKKNQTDPMTREKLTVDMLIEDKEYSKKIKEYKKKFRKEIRKNNKD